MNARLRTTNPSLYTCSSLTSACSSPPLRHSVSLLSSSLLQLPACATSSISGASKKAAQPRRRSCGSLDPLTNSPRPLISLTSTFSAILALLLGSREPTTTRAQKVRPGDLDFFLRWCSFDRHSLTELEKVTVTPTGAEGTQDSFSNISDVFDNLLLLNLPPKASGFDEAICNVRVPGTTIAVCPTAHYKSRRYIPSKPRHRHESLSPSLDKSP